MSITHKVVSSAAKLDLETQGDWYRANADKAVAERYLNAFLITLEQIQQQPELGRPRKFRDTRLQGLRSIVLHGSFRVHLLFYRLEGATLVVFRVIHGMRDLPRRLLEEQ